jgi:hypothetical protein
VEISGFANGQTLDSATTGTLGFSTLATPSSNVGSYAITGGGLTANNGNYVFVQAPGNANAFAIAPATLTYVANAASSSYGAAIPALTGTVSGFANGQTLASATTGTLGFSTLATVCAVENDYACKKRGQLPLFLYQNSRTCSRRAT